MEQEYVELVIKIPKDMYENFKAGKQDECDIRFLIIDVLDGVVLPENHGRLIDVNELCKKLNEHMEFNWQVELCIGCTDTIIPGNIDDN